MNVFAKPLAALAAVALFVAMGYTSLFAFQDFGDRADLDGLPCPSPFVEPQDGLISTASVLPHDELPMTFTDQDPDKPWVRSVKQVLRRIDTLESSLDAYGTPAPKDGASDLSRSVLALGYGRAVERVLRRMKEVVGTYRSLSPGERKLLTTLDPDSQVRLLDKAREQDTQIDRFLDYLSQRRAVHVEAMRRASRTSGKAASVAAPARKETPVEAPAAETKAPAVEPATVETPKPAASAVPSSNMSGDLYEDWESRQSAHPRLPAGHDPMPVPAREGDDIAAAAASLGADILAVTDCVVSKAASRESSTYRQNEEKELGSVSRGALTRLALFGNTALGEVTTVNRCGNLSPILRGLR